MYSVFARIVNRGEVGDVGVTPWVGRARCPAKVVPQDHLAPARHREAMAAKPMVRSDDRDLGFARSARAARTDGGWQRLGRRRGHGQYRDNAEGGSRDRHARAASSWRISLGSMKRTSSSTVRSSETSSAARAEK